MKNMSKIMWGFVLIVVGLIMSINALGFTHIDIFFDGWWTLFIIIPSIIGLLTDDDKYSSFIWLIVGVALLLGAQGYISFHLLYKLIVPFIIVVIGLSILHKGIYGEKVKEKVHIEDVKDLETISVVMSDEHKSLKGDFKGCVVDVVFGHATLDLSDAKIKDGASIKISTVFGKTDIILPPDVKIKMNSTRIFGSVSQVQKEASKKEEIIYIEAVSVFGGTFIR